MRKKRKSIFCLMIFSLVLVEMTSIFLMYKSVDSKRTLLDNVSLKEKIKEMKGIAIMLEQSDGTYSQSESNAFPTDMVYNSSKSGCIDNNGNKIEEALTYSNGIANVETSNTTYCYLYFDIDTDANKLANKIIEIDNETDIGLQQIKIIGDDLYRFSGTSGNTGINNYICLGSTSCASGDDSMYRIIGINPDNGEIKVIKETPWNNKAGYPWHGTNEEITWLTSDLYTNTVSKIYDELIFKNMIVENHTWNVGTAGNDLIATRESIIDYENNTTGTATIGIISLTDYYLAYNGDRNWFSDYDLTTNWIGGYLNGNTTNHEWTMTYYDYYDVSSYYCAWGVNYIYGLARRNILTSSYVVRPTFYLNSDVQYVSGDGSSTNPFIVE